MEGEVDISVTNTVEATPLSEATTETKEPQPSVEDLAAHDYQKLLPKFREKLHPLSRRQMEKVVVALMGYPFEDNAPKFSYPEERDLFYLGIQIQDCSFIIKRAVYDLMKDSEKMKEFNKELNKLKEQDTNNLKIEEKGKNETHSMV